MKIETNPAIDMKLSLDSELEFTVATEMDFEEIMSISKDVYGGLDYLPARYQTWIHQPNRTVMLAKKDGKVIALQSVYIIDEGETVLVEGLRVAPTERGKGVAGIIQKYCTEFVKKKYPDVKVIRLTRDDKLGPKDFKKYRLLSKQGILLVRFNAEELCSRLGDIVAQMKAAGTDMRPYVVLDQNEVQDVVLNNEILHEVLPNKTIIQDWQPFKPLQSNMQLLMEKDLHWIVDHIQIPNVVSLCTSPFRIPIGEDWYYLNIDLFGKDLSHLKSQFIGHLQNLMQNLRGSIMCQMFLEPSLWEDMADFCKNIMDVEIARHYTEQYLLESDI
ncbi:histidine N-acetyltransferase [Latimeria chalumnae]|uniref:N-acetyltransferase 16 (putative) n=1 Tax=Latimeria chalumnae TaxID=7897 RepID=H3AID0_LATCH|nr:PREDICTED: probable N-acetyltransferase 16 [Latimeria chalumnae]|eukprot:XP_006009593.1 PREDICTED: probable N-acetyltransferase 16 [Latimeria chalumnae]